ncbi:Hypothetical predicted protein [Paramuricea clavata]|uniref:Uncharacterized protein n=1 Tax=Paramuricea clavata TaxID=317549 RepID=A0A7D9DKT2_PARCT|nr:Hypothetical predicted protein [Paramuricea clavata]
MIVSESDDQDNPEEWLQVNDPLGGKERELISKKIKSVKRHTRRQIARRIAEERLLRRRRSKRVGSVLTKYPTIVKDIGTFVHSSGVGAEAWRRTGVLTFDGNRKVKCKVTFARIKTHLEEKRRPSHVQELEMVSRSNDHWSNALHKGLDVVQFKDGRDKVLLNRDDLSVFRLDTVASNKAPTVCIQGKPSLTTKTDCQASYPNTLQTTSYNFTASENNGEVYAGVVKSSGIHSKNQAQHAADLELLQQKSEVKDVFINPEMHNPKEIECIRVDSGGDEALYYQEVQFWWTLHHIRRPARLQLITCRYSGGRSLNRVELQNGCKVKSHSGLFIPSTLNGSNLCKESRDVDKVKLEQNLGDAIDIYISRVSGAPCGNKKNQTFSW